MPSNWTLRDFKRVFKKHGVTFRYTKHGHIKMTRLNHGLTLNYIVPTVSGREVKALYVKKARKALRLSKDNGVPDVDFSA